MGFEPTVFKLYKDLANLHFKPLSHLSGTANKKQNEGIANCQN